MMVRKIGTPITKLLNIVPSRARGLHMSHKSQVVSQFCAPAVKALTRQHVSTCSSEPLSSTYS